MKKLSIITICYNSPYIEETCQSIKEQTWQNFEWIVVDGASDFPTFKILQKYRDYMDVFISEPDNGRYHAMNKGIARAKGEYLLFLNGGDSLVSSDTLRRIFTYTPIPGLEKCMPQAYAADICYGQVLARETGMFPWPMWPIGEQKINIDFFISHSLPHQATFIRKSLFEKIGGYDENFHSAGDLEWFMRALLKYKSTYIYIPIPVSIYNFEGISSQCNLPTSIAIQERNIILKKFIPIYKKNNIFWLKLFRWRYILPTIIISVLCFIWYFINFFCWNIPDFLFGIFITAYIFLSFYSIQKKISK